MKIISLVCIKLNFDQNFESNINSKVEKNLIPVLSFTFENFDLSIPEFANTVFEISQSLDGRSPYKILETE